MRPRQAANPKGGLQMERFEWSVESSPVLESWVTWVVSCGGEGRGEEVEGALDWMEPLGGEGFGTVRWG